jgi:hypothetical protein
MKIVFLIMFAVGILGAIYYAALDDPTFAVDFLIIANVATYSLLIQKK